MERIPCLAVLVLILGLAAGCLGESNSAPKPAAVTVAGDEVVCHIQSCPRWQSTASGLTITLGDYDVDHAATVGVVLDSPSVSVAVQGSLKGVMFGVLIQGELCDQCTITLSDGEIRAEGGAVRANMSGGRLVLQNVSVTTPGGGQVSYQDVDGDSSTGTLVTRFGGTDGMTLAAQNTDIEIRDVAATAVRTSASDGARLVLDANGSVHVHGLRISGYDQGIRLVALAATLTDVEIVCERVGIDATTAEMTLDEIVIDGCQDHTILAKDTVQMRARGLQLTNSRVGLELGADESVRIQGFNISSNDYGLLLAGDQVTREQAVLVDGEVRNNAFVGLQTKWNTTTIEDVLFEGNGLQSPDPNGSRDEVDYGAIVHRGPRAAVSMATFSGNAFVGNSPYAVSNVGSSPVDARDNWWGSPTGPRHEAAGAGTAAPGEQTVNGLVWTTPHRVAPAVCGTCAMATV